MIEIFIYVPSEKQAVRTHPLIVMPILINHKFWTVVNDSNKDINSDINQFCSSPCLKGNACCF